MTRLYPYLLLLCCLLLFTIPAIAQDDDSSEDVIISDAFVNTAELADTNDAATLLITGDLPDSCTEINEISQERIDDVIQITVTTTRPADAACATVLDSFEIDYTIETTGLDDGTYTVDVNGITLTLTLPLEIAVTCPEADDDTNLFDEQGVCFVYPSEFDIFSGRDFIFINQPLTSNAVLLITIDDANETTFDDLRETLDSDDVLIEDVVIGTQDALIIDRETMREAYILVEDRLYHFVVQPLSDDEETGEILWATVLDSVFFPMDEVSD
ncbi:MAG: hypothetical protein WBC91_12415 [Phototrophicaceae bacterium]